MTRNLTYIILTIGLISCGLTFDKQGKVKSGKIEISWEENLKGDFSFTKNWEYPAGVYKNDFGQLSCDGLCPPEIEGMKDENGKIYKDSLQVFYKLVDTIHQFHSVQSDASTYEWVGTNFATARKINDDTTIFFTHNNIGTHCSLNLTITKDKCVPTIQLTSVTRPDRKIYYCKKGQINIDKSLWEKGIFKANFDFDFDDTENQNKPMYWRGKIFAHIDCR